MWIYILAFLMFFIPGVIVFVIMNISEGFSFLSIVVSLIPISISIACLIKGINHNKVKRANILRLTPKEKSEYYIKKQSVKSKSIDPTNIIWWVIFPLFGITFVTVGVEGKEILFIIVGIVFILVPFMMLFLERKNK